MLLGDFVECEVHAAGFYFLGMKIGHNNNTTLPPPVGRYVVWYLNNSIVAKKSAYGSSDEPHQNDSAS